MTENQKIKSGNSLIISDIHFPYHNRNAFDFLAETSRKWKCTKFYSTGDMFDLHRTGKHLPEPTAMSMEDEIAMARVAVKILSRIFKDVKTVYGNHDLRGFKAAKEKGITQEMMKSIPELFECPKTWEFGDEYLIDGKVILFHGDGYSGVKGAIDAASKRRSSVAIGHLHSYGGVLYHDNGYNRIFGLNTGCLIDDSLPAFNYAKTSKDKPTLGCGVIIDGGNEGYFIPLPV